MPNGTGQAVTVLTIGAVVVVGFLFFRKQITDFFSNIAPVDDFKLFVAAPSPQEIADALAARRDLTSEQALDYTFQYNELIARTRQITREDSTISDSAAWRQAQEELGRLPALPPITR